MANKPPDHGDVVCPGKKKGRSGSRGGPDLLSLKSLPQLSRKLRSLRDRLGCLSFLSALASI
jgi:hypothetical protein